MAREKNPVHKVQMPEEKQDIIHQFLEEYDIQSTENIQGALKDLLNGTIKKLLEAEMIIKRNMSPTVMAQAYPHIPKE